MLTGGDPASVVRAFDAGADDCIRWPYDTQEMLARVRSMLRIKNLHDELHRVNAQLMELSTRDGLTGLYNRRYLFESLATEVERAVRYQSPLSLLMLDMDDFKPINDRYGHLVGDELFRQAAETFRSIPRRVDVIARYGGDEVAILLPASGIEAALSVAHRVCDTVAQKKFAVGDIRITMTVSLGVACLEARNPITSDELVRRADVALYASKHAGGNRVTAWDVRLEG
jgi:two-component system cell cycle response regulator